MGRSPCCDKVGLKKGPWTPEEDQKLLAYIEEHGHGSWRSLPLKAGLQRCGKSCRLRWTNYLRPDIKRGKFSLQEEQTIIQLHALLGNRWSAIATHLPKRTDNEIKNYWNTHLKKRLAKMGIDPVSHKPKNDALLSSDGQSKSTASLSHMAQWESARLEAEARLVKQSKLRAGSIQSQVVTAQPVNHALAQPQGPPPRCLDILKAWNGVWGSAKRMEGGGSLMGDQESPSSALSSTGLGGSSATLVEYIGHSLDSCKEEEEEGEEEDWKDFGCSSTFLGNSVPLPFLPGTVAGAMTMPPLEAAWTTESLSSWSSNETVPGSNFLESFTDLLLNSNNDHRDRCIQGKDHSDICGAACASIGNACDEDDKNYLNSILNMVNSPPSDSSVF